MDEDKEIYRVVINDEEQYSIWPEYRDIPAGWRAVGVTGNKQTCLDHIETVWTDMRPLSLRKRMEELAKNPPAPVSPPPADEPSAPTLVERLSNGHHPVEISLRPAKDMRRFKECLDRKYVHVRFTGTRGTTELGVRLEEGTDLSGADFDNGTGEAKIVGTLELDFVKVQCHATVKLPELLGDGYLVPVAS